MTGRAVWRRKGMGTFIMMLYPAMGELNARIHNRYMLVNVVAKRARQIAAAYENAHQILNEKPVTTAINEVASGELYDPERASAPEAAEDTEDVAVEETEVEADAEPVEETETDADENENADEETD